MIENKDVEICAFLTLTENIYYTYISLWISCYDKSGETMDFLNLQKLKRCCRPDATEMDDLEQEVVEGILLKHLSWELDVYKITHSLCHGGYIGDEAFRNVQRFLNKDEGICEKKINDRVVRYIASKISFIGLLWALATSGYQKYANLLLDALEKARFSTVSASVKKVPIVQSRKMHLLVKQLKYVSDSKIFDNPVAFIRRLAMHFKGSFVTETEVNRKRKMADRYFAVLAVEMDNFSFMLNKFVTFKAMAAETRRVIPFTSNPVMNEALLNGRIAEMTALNGDVKAATSLVQDVITIMLSTEECPESGNLVQTQLNVLLHDYEYQPSNDKKDFYIEMGYNGLRLLRVLDDEIVSYFKISYMLRIIFCALDLSICGKPLCFLPSKKSVEIAQYFLREVRQTVETYGLRKAMCYNLAMGRMLHVTGNVREAIVYLKRAKSVAQKSGFVEFQHIEHYEKSLSTAPEKTSTLSETMATGEKHI